MAFTIADALNKTGKPYYIKNNDYDELIWDSESPKPTLKELEDERDQMQADYDAKQYSRDRQQEYPSIQECVHAILDDDLTAIQTKRKLIKDKYPKPE